MPQQIDRLLVSRGPAMITHRGGIFFTREDLTVDLTKETKAIPSSAFGDLTHVNLGVKASATFRPIGEFEHLAVLWPYATTPIGRSIFGDADYPVLIQPLDDAQRQVTFHAGGVSKMPDLTFTAADTIIGDVELQMIGANNVPTDDPDRLFSFAANTIDLEALPYDPDALLIQAYQNRWLSAGTFTLTYGADTTAAIAYDANLATVDAAFSLLASVVAAGGATVTGDLDAGWTITFDALGDRGPITGVATAMPGGTSVRADVLQAGTAGLPEIVRARLFPWHSFQAREGVKVTFGLQLTVVESDAIGHYDSSFGGLTVDLAAEPQGLDIETILAAAAVQGAGAVRGRKLSTGAHDLVVTGDGVHFTLYGANLKTAGMVFGATNQRIPELQWSASRTIGAGGVLNPLFRIGTEAP